MGLSTTTLGTFVESHHLAHETVTHEHSESSLRSAAAAHLPGDKLVKSVLLKDGDGYLLAVLPASRRLHLSLLHRRLNRHVGLATEAELADLFPDCDLGAVPPTGLMYGIDTVVDDSLLAQPDVFLEAGDHEHLIHVSQQDFRRLMGDATHSDFSYAP